ncbi:MAG: trehalose-6-phosphate synthase, partial [Gammaproteobacteria bacterium]|nr:trehalose-6-phosphate synthase [Gammaproteobacteria bacterium]
MGRLVAVSNRVALPRGGKSAGGLAVGLMAAFKEQGGLWFGWSGSTTPKEPGETKITTSGRMRFATVDLNEREHEAYYNGFSNNTLWPLFHFLLTFFSYSRLEYEAYCRVNQFFARRLLALLEPDDIVWVHDYHLIPLARELRRAGVRQPIGFFLHVPFPNFDLLRALPCYDDLLEALTDYDVVGLQTERDLWSFHECLSQPQIGGEVLGEGRVRAFGRELYAGAFPIGVDADQCRALAADSPDRPQLARMRSSLGDRKLIIGVDRLD